jgi:hypothetical protein
MIGLQGSAVAPPPPTASDPAAINMVNVRQNIRDV